jgi:uncharacterized protein (TIGR02996 family)
MMHPDERALLAAIIADPDEDTLRLAYADWLDENADSLPKARREPALARAALIRLHVQMAGLVFGSRGFHKRYDELQSREWELGTQKHYKAWVAELEGITPARGVDFYYHRGLFGEVACSAKYFVEHGAALFAAAPITAVRIKTLALSRVKSLAECPHFTRIRTLKICPAETAVIAICELLDRAPLGHLHGLAFENWLANYGSTDHADPIAEHVARCAKLSRLKRLNFSAAGISSVGGRALAASPHLANLEVLDLRTNPTMRAVATVRKRFGKRVWLDYDDLKGLPIGYQDQD